MPSLMGCGSFGQHGCRIHKPDHAYCAEVQSLFGPSCLLASATLLTGALLMLWILLDVFIHEALVWRLDHLACRVGVLLASR